MTGESASVSEFTVGYTAGGRLDLLVADHASVSRTQAATLIANGNVLVNGAREKASYKGETGDVVRVTIPPPPGRDIVAEQIPLDVVYEDEHLLVVDKAAGMVVHPAPGNWTGTLVNALLGRGEPLAEGGGEDRAGLVHRLDKDTSGLLVVAKSDAAHRTLSSALAARQVTRRYAAVCWGHLAEERITVEKPIARDPRDRTRMAIVQSGKASRTDFTRLARFDSVDLLRAHLHTGRTHQIRVHLASTGHPVVGDDTYGGGGGRRLALLPPRRHFLHAAWLRFRHPISGDLIDLRSPLPADLRTSLAALGSMPELATQQDPLETFHFYDTD
ncbi:MAG TPA: RluA family pseudouridine synthase [Gemmatimonas aurantiaca]|uniref:Pseudouridine synthase n=2 Tax=Gemmatimonas aurantiaca TaxID=173480 RepID=C1A885_GEMAT|nr:RluA family pseudouridine synthase [Gemmatimonas aurantiaca]BAH38445.1 ribosomal large subunit pseudouridine synthase D [Gemmatimonas aurantiaca T-27]HCT56227.1 RluA family pseudouridine synthase [Gemmatimonas aurantiaca]